MTEMAPLTDEEIGRTPEELKSKTAELRAAWEARYPEQCANDRVRAAEYLSFAEQIREWLHGIPGERNPSEHLPAVFSLVYEAVALDPHNHEGFNFLGDLYRQLGARDFAISCYERAMNLAPENPEYRANLESIKGVDDLPLPEEPARDVPLAQIFSRHASTILEKYNDYDAIFSLQERAVMLDPDRAEYSYKLAASYLDMDMLEPARVCAGKAVELTQRDCEGTTDQEKKRQAFGGHVNSHALYGVICNRMGDHAAAAHSLKFVAGTGVNIANTAIGDALENSLRALGQWEDRPLSQLAEASRNAPVAAP